MEEQYDPKDRSYWLRKSALRRGRQNGYLRARRQAHIDLQRIHYSEYRRFYLDNGKTLIPASISHQLNMLNYLSEEEKDRRAELEFQATQMAKAAAKERRRLKKRRKLLGT